MVPSTSTSFLNKVVVVTGGGSGIGKALCLVFAQAGAFVVVVDHREGSTNETLLLLPSPWKHLALQVDVTNEMAVSNMIRSIQQRYHRIDVYCSNAGIMIPPSNNRGADDSCVKHSLEEWNRLLQVNVLSHVTAFRALLPAWEQGVGEGHFLVTASAAGLLTMMGDASYGVSKAAALSFCEHVAIAHADCVKVHCLCPQAVDTPLVVAASAAAQGQDPKNNLHNAAAVDGLLSPEQVAKVTLEGIARGEFFILPHPQVSTYALRKAKDHARWLKGMQRLRISTLFRGSTSKL